MRTPAHMAATPSHGLQGVDAATIQRATAGLPNSVFNTLAQVAGNTPGFPQAQQGMVNTSFERTEYNIISSISVRFNLIRKCVAIFFSHLKLCLATAIHNFKWEKNIFV